MARNEEKALAALNRWTAQKRDLEMATNLGKSTYMGGALPPSAQYGPYKAQKRPKLAFEVNTVKECEHWRSEIIRGVAKKIGEIQNAALGEHRIRDLNDEINKDLREKGHWEDRIKELGGADYKAIAPKADETYGAELAAHSGYKYFGAAKDLPGVREMFEVEAIPEAPRKTRKQLFKNIQPDYYGWRDEEDGMLLLAEQEFEIEAVRKEVARWQASPAARKKRRRAEEEAAEAKGPEAPGRRGGEAEAPEEAGAAAVGASDKDSTAAKDGSSVDFKAYVDVPTMEDIQRLIVQKKKDALLKKYTSKELQKRSKEASELLVGQESGSAAPPKAPEEPDAAAAAPAEGGAAPPA